MKHRKSGRILGRTRRGRKALLKTLLGSLIMHEKIATTEAKAKELKNFVDQIVNKAKTVKEDDRKRLAMIRILAEQLPDMAVRKLVRGDFVDRFSGRTSGYTRIVKLEDRKGDGARMAVIEFVS